MKNNAGCASTNEIETIELEPTYPNRLLLKRHTSKEEVLQILGVCKCKHASLSVYKNTPWSYEEAKNILFHAMDALADVDYEERKWDCERESKYDNCMEIPAAADVYATELEECLHWSVKFKSFRDFIEYFNMVDVFIDPTDGTYDPNAAVEDVKRLYGALDVICPPFYALREDGMETEGDVIVIFSSPHPYVHNPVKK